MAQQINRNNSNSPHLSSHLHNGSAPTSPSMSNPQQGGQSRGPGYPSPTSTSYPDPQYNYPQVSDPYSPAGSNASVSLPSMRSQLDPFQAQHHPNMANLPPVAQMGGYPGQGMPYPQYPNVTSDPNARYALPMNVDQRTMSGGRHKKVSYILLLGL